MTAPWRAVLASLPLLAVAGCAYDPPVRGDRASAQYRQDLGACRTATAERVDRENAKRGPRWVASPVTRPFQLRTGIRACMEEKGYAAQG